MVFCEKNCLGSSAHEDFLDFRTSFSRTVDCGQIDVEDASLVDLTLHFDMSEMLFDNAKNGGQTHARAFAFLVDSEEWLTNIFSMVAASVPVPSSDTDRRT